MGTKVSSGQLAKFDKINNNAVPNFWRQSRQEG